MLDSVELLKYQPNRYPFLVIDYVTEVCPEKYAKDYKNLTINEWYISTHFPGNPNIPGALPLEALVQILTVAILTILGMKGKIVHGLKHTDWFKREVNPVEWRQLIPRSQN